MTNQAFWTQVANAIMTIVIWEILKFVFWRKSR